jgi:hypothetical protein
VHLEKTKKLSQKKTSNFYRKKDKNYKILVMIFIIYLKLIKKQLKFVTKMTKRMVAVVAHPQRGTNNETSYACSSAHLSRPRSALADRVRFFSEHSRERL